MKCVLLILSCEKHTHYALKQKQSWLKHIPHYYHLIGSKKMCGDNRYVFDETNKIIYTKTDDDYLSLSAKVITGFLAIYQTKQVDYIFKTDVNQMLIQPDFFKILIDTLKVNNICYGGHALHLKTHTSSLYTTHPEFPRDVTLEGCTYCTGPFYLLHISAVENLLYKYPLIYNCLVEDHSMGYYLDTRFRNKLLSLDTQNIFKELL